MSLFVDAFERWPPYVGWEPIWNWDFTELRVYSIHDEYLSLPEKAVLVEDFESANILVGAIRLDYNGPKRVEIFKGMVWYVKERDVSPVAHRIIQLRGGV